MNGRSTAPVILALTLGVGACTSVTGPQLPAGPVPIETSSTASPAPPGSEPGTPLAAIIAKTTPTETYELVARGALGCWFGARGPLKPTHVFHAEAAPPVEGGAAEIVLHERDASFRDLRGPRAFRVTFATAPAGAQVNVVNLKMAPPVGTAMAKDVEAWAAGGAGCQLRAVLPPPPSPAPSKAKGKGKTPAKAAKPT
jgi:hypothetical protein